MTRLPELTVLGIPLRTSWAWIAVALAMAIISVTQLAPPDEHALLWSLWAVIVGVGAITSIFAHEFAHIAVARRLNTSFTSLEPSTVGALPDTCYPPESPAREVRVAIAGPAVSLALAVLFGAIWWATGAPRDLPWISIGDRRGVQWRTRNARPVARLPVRRWQDFPGIPLVSHGRSRQGNTHRLDLWACPAVSDSSGRRHPALYRQRSGGVGYLGSDPLLDHQPRSCRGILAGALERGRKSLQINDLFQAGVNRVRATSTVDECIESLLDNFRRGPTLVVEENAVTGIVDLVQVRRVPRANWTQIPVSEVMLPIDDLPRMEDSAPVSRLLRELPKGSRNIVLIERNGSIIAAANREFVMDRVESYIRAQHFARRRRRS